MSEKIRAIIDAVTDKVLSYRPVDKALARAALAASALRARAKEQSGE